MVNAEIINQIFELAKATFSLAAAIYVLGLVLKRFKPKPPPCANCKHLELYNKSGSFDSEPWKCARRNEWYGNGVRYCVYFEPREEDENESEEEDDEW